MLKKPELFLNGFYETTFEFDQEIKELVLNENWDGIDQELKRLTSSGGELFCFLGAFHDFSAIEFIIALRDSKNEWEEDGIWHDDGSRVFAFSLSLTLDPGSIEGGLLGIRKKGKVDYLQVPTPPFGGIILFLTGTYGYEHKIHAVRKGRRLVIAGWCS
jgi:hypothetical protein